MHRLATLALTSLVVAACAPGSGSAPSPEVPRPAIQRVLVAGIRAEPTSLAIKSIGAATFAGNSMVTRYFNADVTRIDAGGAVQPYLAAEVPQLNTDSWRVSPDGRMEITWKFRPGIIWQDGTPASMQDFLFAWEIYSKPDSGWAASAFVKAIDQVKAVDDHTLAISYRLPFPDALTDTLPPLPRHLLIDSFEANDANTFASDAYWSRSYVGLGPWILTRWEPGSFVEGSAFEQHILGRPKIDRVRAEFISDLNTALAKTLAGEVHVVAGGTFISIDQSRELKSRWDETDGGTVALYGTLWRLSSFQLRPDYATPAALLDPRVRKALAHAVNKDALGDAIYGPGLMRPSDFFVPPDSIYGGPTLEAAVTKYGFDPRRADQLMNEAGFIRGADNFYANAAGRFQTRLETATERQDEMTIMASEWRKLGFDIQDGVLSPALATDSRARVLFSGISSFTTNQLPQVASMTSAQCPKADSNYRVGNNRGCWLNAEFDRLSNAFSTTLDQRERATQVAGMGKAFSEDLPVIPLHFVTQPYFWVSGLQGVKAPTSSDGEIKSNIYEWEWVK